MKHIHILLFAASTHSASTYVWPGKYDYLEDLYTLYTGSIQSRFTDQGAPSRTGKGLVPIANAPERVRTAFHDVITFDKNTGQGGLDASIMFELDRPENKGAAFNNTLNAIKDMVTTKSSVADLLAMTLAASCVTCKGPQIPLRFGRVDAKAAGPATGATSGVPSPLDDVEVSTQKFASAGFSQDDMITLLACGHTLGRVHSVNLPGAFDSPPSNDLNADFDTTRVTFDNLVVSEFLSGNSKNPLVVAKNDSFNSDKRIFSINDRAVVQKLNDPAEFKQQCVAVLERMINTVPSNVRLSNPINLIDVKPYITNLELQKDGNILFEGRVRFRRSALSDRNPDDLDVALRIVDHTGSRTHTLVPATREQLQTFDTQEFVWYDFSKAVDGQVGLKGFDIQVQDKNNPNVQSIVISNGGAGTFPVTTDILYQLSNSCLDTSKDPGKLIVVTAVRRRSNGRCRRVPQLRLSKKIPREGVMIPRLHVEHTKMTKTDKQIGQYDLYRAELDLASPSWSSTFDVRIPFGPKRELLFLRELANKQCEEL